LEHSFDINLALIVGIEKAIILKNIHWWVTANTKNKSDRHFHNGKYWTYNTAAAFNSLFPYMPPRSIARWLVDLEKDGWLEVGNFNKARYDKTKWFTRGVKYIEYLEKTADPFIGNVKNAEKSDCQNGRGIDESLSHIDETLCQNGLSISQDGNTIPDINTYINSYNNDNNFSESDISRKDKYVFDYEDINEIKLRVEQLFITYAPELKRHFTNIEKIAREMNDARTEISKKEIWKIIVESFMDFPALADSKACFNYLLKVIQGKKNTVVQNYYSTKNKNEAVGQRKRSADAEKRENELSEKRALDDIAGRLDKFKDKLSKTEVEKVSGLLRQQKFMSAEMELINILAKKRIIDYAA
jgi:hypothetical protein